MIFRHPIGLGEFEPDAGVTIVTDHHARGTNVLVGPNGPLLSLLATVGSLAQAQREKPERLKRCQYRGDSRQSVAL